MGKPFLVLDDLKLRFKEFDQIAEITGKLHDALQEINKDNRSAGGSSDAVARTYHEQIDEPTTFLTDLVKVIQDEFHLTGEKGGVLAQNFDAAQDDASWAAENW